MTLYLHATTSSVLVGMSYSNFSLISPEKLIVDYGIAPISGEIFAGGQDGATLSSGIAFAKHGDHFYDLNQLLNAYGKYNYKSGREYNTAKDIVDSVNEITTNNFISIKPLILKLMRACHMGEQIKLGPNDIESLSNKINSALLKVKQYYIRNYIVTCYLKSEKKSWGAQHKFLDYLVDYIPDDFLSQNDDNKNKFIASLEDLFKSFVEKNQKKFSHYELDIKSKFSNYFSVKDNAKSLNEKVFDSCDEYSFCTSMIDPTDTDFIYSYLHPAEEDEALIVDDIILKGKIETACIKLTAIVNHLKKTLSGDIKEFTKAEKDFCRKNFTIIFLIDSDKADEVLRPCKYEYRSNRDLQLGSDIKKIATYPENMQTVREFLSTHEIENVEVVSIDSLRPQVKSANPELSAMNAALSFFGNKAINMPSVSDSPKQQPPGMHA